MFTVVVPIAHRSVVDNLVIFFGVGSVYLQNDNAIYRVSSVKDLVVIISHFTSFPLVSPKVLVYNL